MERDSRKRASWLLKNLKKTYPKAHCELSHQNALELLIATILSAQCTDKRVNLVTQDLFKRYRRAGDYARAPLAKLEADIRSTGFYKNKAKSIRGTCQVIDNEYRGRVPDKMEDLVKLRGVGRKTANVVLGNVYGKSEGIVVDTHVTRISQLLGLTKEKNPEKIESDLMWLFPKKEWTLLAHLLIWHGRNRCIARRPDCFHCELRPQCPYGLKAAKKAG